MNGLAASYHKVFSNDGADPLMVELTDLLAKVAMQFCQDHPDAIPGKYLVEIGQQGSVMSLRASSETWENDEVALVEPTPDVLADMYEQIVPSAAAYFAESGEKPPLAMDMYERFVAAGYDMSMVEPVSYRVLQ